MDRPRPTVRSSRDLIQRAVGAPAGFRVGARVSRVSAEAGARVQLCVRVHVGVRLACFLLGMRIKVALYLRPPV